MKLKTRIEKLVDRHSGKIILTSTVVTVVAATYLYVTYKNLHLLVLNNNAARYLRNGGLAIFTIDGVDYALKVSDV